MSQVLSLKPSYYEALRRLTLELVGIKLGPDHAFLIETRLRTLARCEGYSDLGQMIDELFCQGQARLALKVVSALLERDMFFNADRLNMKRMENFVIPELTKAGNRGVVRVLSFGCSSGQEAYSIAMLLEKYKAIKPKLQAEIVGIDYPSPALERAKKGRYTHFEIQRGLPIRDVLQFFDKVGEDWVVNDALRQLVEFREKHLLSSLSDMGVYDVVFFRNGLPYYSSAAQIRVLRSLSTIVRPGGFLLLGANEDVPKIRYGFEVIPDMPGIYRKDPVSEQVHKPSDASVSNAIEMERLSLLEKSIPL